MAAESGSYVCSIQRDAFGSEKEECSLSTSSMPYHSALSPWKALLAGMPLLLLAPWRIDDASQLIFLADNPLRMWSR
jgi:hypothetical protein